MPKLKLGAAFYALIAVGLAASAVGVFRGWGAYSEVHGWPIPAIAAVDGLSALLFAIGALTRRGLVADDGPWICRNGWMVMVGLTAAAALVVFVSDQGMSPFPTGPAVFWPHFVRKLQENYYAGVEEAEVEIRAARDGVPPPGR
jgi:hypothetical protein